MKFAMPVSLFLAFAALGTMVVFANPPLTHRSITIVNHSSLSVREFYASNISKKDWGPEILGPDRPIPPNHKLSLSLDDDTDQCYFDLKAVLADRHYMTLRNGDACKPNQTWELDDSSGTLEIEVANTSEVGIRYFYAVEKRAAAKGWGDDLLGPGNLIWAGRKKIINIYRGTPGCYYDLRAVWFNGETRQFTNFDACAHTGWQVGDDVGHHD